MAETTGLAASMITLVELTYKIVGYLRTVKEGGNAREKLKIELMFVSSTIRSHELSNSMEPLLASGYIPVPVELPLTCFARISKMEF
jgi:hypothetical protein